MGEICKHINYRSRTDEGVIIPSGQVRNNFTVDTGQEQSFNNKEEFGRCV